MQRTSTFLMFVGDQCGRAEEAIGFYTSLFDDSAVLSVERWGPGEPGGTEGLVKRAVFSLSGQEYMASENTMAHQFGFNPAISIYVHCAHEAELDRLFAQLSSGGEVLMPVGDYGFSRRFGWVSDRFGLTWQLDLPT